jgi:tetratricopeptide (TPR) repeat protein
LRPRHFSDPGSQDYWLRIRRWEQSAEKVYAAFPDDPEAAAFYALAHLATTPQDVVSRAHADRAAEILLQVYERNPDHPGAMHYLVHANDVPGREHELLEITNKYESIAPHNPHALHMPTHIYTRLGDWPAVIRGNVLAAEAALITPAGDHGELSGTSSARDRVPGVRVPATGRDHEAATQLKRLHDTPRLEPTFKTAFHLRRRERATCWSVARGTRPSARATRPAALDWDRFAWAEAVTWFARVSARRTLGKLTRRGRRAASRATRESTRAAGEELLRATSACCGSRRAGSRRRRGSGTLGSSMREAADLETSTPKHPVTPAPTLPAYELLGDLLMEQKRPAEALDAYRRSLESNPRRYNSLLGAARADARADDAPQTGAYYKQLLEVASADATRRRSPRRDFLRQPE